MCRRRECIGIGLFALGLGLILSLLFQSVLCTLLLAFALIAGGCFCMK